MPSYKASVVQGSNSQKYVDICLFGSLTIGVQLVGSTLTWWSPMYTFIISKNVCKHELQDLFLEMIDGYILIWNGSLYVKFKDESQFPSWIIVHV